MNKSKVKYKIWLILTVMMLVLFGNILTVCAKSDRTYYKEMLQRHYNNLKIE